MSVVRKIKYKQVKPTTAEINYKEKYDHTVGLLRAMNQDTGESRERNNAGQKSSQKPRLGKALLLAE